MPLYAVLPINSLFYLKYYGYFVFTAVITQDGVHVLDMAAKIDATADYLCKAKWGDVEFPPPFGREAYPEVRPDVGLPVSLRNQE